MTPRFANADLGANSAKNPRYSAILGPIRKTCFCALLVLSACKGDPIYRDRTVTVNVPVAQPCANPRPATVTPLSERYSDEAWQALDARQKAAAVARQGLDRQTYGEQLYAATAGCPVISE